MAAESKLQSKIRKHLSAQGWVVAKIMLCGSPGWPDVYALKDGRHIWMEIKDNRKLDPLQEYRGRTIIEHGGEFYRIGTWEEFKALDL